MAMVKLGLARQEQSTVHGPNVVAVVLLLIPLIAGLAVTAGTPPEDPATLSPEEQARRRALLYNQRARPAPAS